MAFAITTSFGTTVSCALLAALVATVTAAPRNPNSRHTSMTSNGSVRRNFDGIRHHLMRILNVKPAILLLELEEKLLAGCLQIATPFRHSTQALLTLLQFEH